MFLRPAATALHLSKEMNRRRCSQWGGARGTSFGGSCFAAKAPIFLSLNSLDILRLAEAYPVDVDCFSSAGVHANFVFVPN
jgi:hypothetical protein